MDDKPTELTVDDIDRFVKDLMEGKYDIKKRPCWKCSKEFYPNYHEAVCNECYFARFPKEDVEAFCRTFLE